MDDHQFSELEASFYQCLGELSAYGYHVLSQIKTKTACSPDVLRLQKIFTLVRVASHSSQASAKDSPLNCIDVSNAQSLSPRRFDEERATFIESFRTQPMPKKPLSAFSLWYRDFKTNPHPEYVNATSTELSRVSAKVWKTQSESLRKEYVRKALALEADYNSRMFDYFVSKMLLGNADSSENEAAFGGLALADVQSSDSEEFQSSNESEPASATLSSPPAENGSIAAKNETSKIKASSALKVNADGTPKKKSETPKKKVANTESTKQDVPKTLEERINTQKTIPVAEEAPPVIVVTTPPPIAPKSAPTEEVPKKKRKKAAKKTEAEAEQNTSDVLGLEFASLPPAIVSVQPAEQHTSAVIGANASKENKSIDAAPVERVKKEKSSKKKATIEAQVPAVQETQQQAAVSSDAAIPNTPQKPAVSGKKNKKQQEVTPLPVTPTIPASTAVASAAPNPEPVSDSLPVPNPKKKKKNKSVVTEQPISN